MIDRDRNCRSGGGVQAHVRYASGELLSAGAKKWALALRSSNREFRRILRRKLFPSPQPLYNKGSIASAIFLSSDANSLASSGESTVWVRSRSICTW